MSAIRKLIEALENAAEGNRRNGRKGAGFWDEMTAAAAAELKEMEAQALTDDSHIADLKTRLADMEAKYEHAYRMACSQDDETVRERDSALTQLAETQEGLSYIASFKHASPCDPCGSMGCLAGRKAQQILDGMVAP